jgi:hypothetical protein
MGVFPGETRPFGVSQDKSQMKSINENSPAEEVNEHILQGRPSDPTDGPYNQR